MDLSSISGESFGVATPAVTFNPPVVSLPPAVVQKVPISQPIVYQDLSSSTLPNSSPPYSANPQGQPSKPVDPIKKNRTIILIVGGVMLFVLIGLLITIFVMNSKKVGIFKPYVPAPGTELIFFNSFSDPTDHSMLTLSSADATAKQQALNSSSSALTANKPTILNQSYPNVNFGVDRENLTCDASGTGAGLIISGTGSTPSNWQAAGCTPAS